MRTATKLVTAYICALMMMAPTTAVATVPSPEPPVTLPAPPELPAPTTPAPETPATDVPPTDTPPETSPTLPPVPEIPATTPVTLPDAIDAPAPVVGRGQFANPNDGLLAAARQALTAAQDELAAALDVAALLTEAGKVTDAALVTAQTNLEAAHKAVADAHIAVAEAKTGVKTAGASVVTAQTNEAMAAAYVQEGFARLGVVDERIALLEARLATQAIVGYVGGPERGAAAWLSTGPEQITPASKTYLAAAAGWTGDDLAEARQTRVETLDEIARRESVLVVAGGRVDQAVVDVTTAEQGVIDAEAAVVVAQDSVITADEAVAVADSAAAEANEALSVANRDVDWVKFLIVEASGRVSVLGGDPQAVAPPTAAATSIVRPFGHIDPVTAVANAWAELQVAPATALNAVETGVVTGVHWSNTQGWVLMMRGVSGTTYLYGRIGAYVGGIDIGVEVFAGETIAYVGAQPSGVAPVTSPVADPSVPTTTLVPVVDDGTKIGTFSFEMRPFGGQAADPAMFLTPLMMRVATLEPAPVVLPPPVAGGVDVKPVFYGQLELGDGVSVRSVMAQWGAEFPMEVAPVLQWGFSQIGTPYAAINPYRFGRSAYGAPWACPPGQLVCTKVDIHQGARTIAAGGYAYDCSGFTVGAWMAGGVDLMKRSATSSQSQKDNLPGVTRENALPGDLVVFDSSSANSRPGTDHVGMYLDDTHMLHAGNCKTYLGVCVTTINWDDVVAISRVR